MSMKGFVAGVVIGWLAGAYLEKKWTDFAMNVAGNIECIRDENGEAIGATIVLKSREDMKKTVDELFRNPGRVFKYAFPW